MYSIKLDWKIYIRYGTGLVSSAENFIFDCQTLRLDNPFSLKKLFRIATVPMSLNILLTGQLRYFNQFFEVTAISGAGEELTEVETREGVKTQVIEMERQISPLKDLISLYHLYRYFKEEKPDIIHSITPKAGLLSMIAGRLAGVPVRIHTFTGLIFPYRKGLMKYILIWMDRLLAFCATHIFPEGQGVKNDLERYRITPKPLSIMGNGNVNGIDTDYFNPSQVSIEEKDSLKQKLGIAEGTMVFVFIGRLVRDKGINELVSAFKNLLELSSDAEKTGPHRDFPVDRINRKVKLILVGPLEQHLNPLLNLTLSEIQKNTYISHTGYVKDVRPYLAISDCLILPSYREGFPNSVLQAGAMGLPSIVTNVNGCNEIIQDRENGLIIPIKNAEALQAAMSQLVEDEVLYQNLQRTARNIIVSRYEQKTVWQAILSEYQKNIHPVD